MAQKVYFMFDHTNRAFGAAGGRVARRGFSQQAGPSSETQQPKNKSKIMMYSW